MSEGYMEKNIGGLTVFWKLFDSKNIDVKIVYENFPIVHELLNKSTHRLPFNLHREGVGDQVRGSLKFEENKPLLPFVDLELDFPVNKNIRLDPFQNPQTLELDDPVNKNIRLDPFPNPQISFEYLDLFPYVYICPWSRIHEEYLKDRFVIYEQLAEMKDNEGASPSFYETLSGLKKTKDRSGMEKESLKFINGEDPYQGRFLSGLEELQSILKDYEPFGRWLRRQRSMDFRSFSSEVEKCLENWDQIIKCIKTPEYQIEKERLWETLFALNITMVYDFKVLEEIVITLVTARMLERVVDIKPVIPPAESEDPNVEKHEEDETGSESEKDIKDTLNGAPKEIETIGKSFDFNQLSSEELYRWVHATILLPDTIFPLPPFKDAGSGENNECVKPSVIPYAIGDLQTVQYRLRRYQLGEVSHIENVLRGECKEVTEKRFMQLKESEILEQNIQDERGAELKNSDADFLDEVNRTLNQRTSSTQIKDYTTNYGVDADKKVNVEGNWNVVEDPAGGYFEDKTGFAKDVVSHTVSRISQKINLMRTKSSLSESEEKVMHRFDNTAGESNILGVYRWLNKVYSLRTVNRGNRLFFELWIEKPAASFLKNECQCHEIRLEKPVSPAELGLKDYKDVSNNENGCYYLDFLAKYDVPELLPPPPQSRVVTAVLESVKPFCALNCEIPNGYEAETVWVYTSFKDDSSKVKVIIGNSGDKYSASDVPIKVELKQPNLEQTIPISIVWLGSETSKKVDDKEKTSEEGANDCNQVNYYLANVEIECKRADTLFREWQLLVFQKIMQGYGKRKAEYYRQIEQQRNKILPPGPHSSRVVEKHQLKRGAFSLLWNIYLENVGRRNDEEKQVTGHIMDKPEYFQFFRNSLEWEEMTYYIHPAWDNAENDDVFLNTEIGEILRDEYFEQADFLNFLKASSARILLPVKPEFTFKFLYFLSSGFIWPGADNLVPATSLHVSLVNEIKALRECKDERKAMENSWEVILPTPMVVLQTDSHLPEFDEYFRNSSRRCEQ